MSLATRLSDLAQRIGAEFKAIRTELANAVLSNGGWVTLRLTADQQISTATWADITGLAFTPAINSEYEVELHLLCQTPTATVGARPGFAWAANLAYGGASLYTPSSATAELVSHGTIGTAAGTLQAPVGGLPTVNVPFRHFGQAHFKSGAAAQGSFKAQLASETAGTAITIKAGSFLKYRKNA